MDQEVVLDLIVLINMSSPQLCTARGATQYVERVKEPEPDCQRKDDAGFLDLVDGGPVFSFSCMEGRTLEVCAAKPIKFTEVHKAVF